MPGPSPALSADRNLLFGVLALQLDFVSQDDLVAAMGAWALDKGKSLGEILRDRGRLSAECLALLSALVDRHVEHHGGDARNSLAVLSAVDGPVRRGLTAIADAELTASLAANGPAGRRAVVTADLPPSPPTRYEILRRHARGGLGEVFVARDHELNRDVALKEIQARHADDPDSRARFLTEAEITGGLEHPGIVPVYGLGAYPDGRPYYAMRFVKGDDLREALAKFHRPGPDFTGLEFRNLLRRFVDTCNAVAYAHSRGVIHRDVKPGNIMLGRFGETLLVDWGIAKAIGRTATGAAERSKDEPTLQPRFGTDSSKTMVGNVLGTPAYMSPEQAGGRIDELAAATDVYSLGATLYELLTGNVPFPDGASDAVQKGLFRPPRQARPGVPRPLEAVCLKAMSRHPDDRYLTALDLAADVERWLADEPVSAWPEPWGLRAQRWARKHRTAVVGTAVFLTSAIVALAMGAGLLWRAEKRTEREWVRAEDNLKATLALSTQLLSIAEDRLPRIAGTEFVRRDMTDSALASMVQSLDQRPGDPQFRHAAAKTYRYSANVHRTLRDMARAESCYRESIRLYDGLTTAQPDEPRYQLEFAELLRDFSQFLSPRGELREAERVLRQSREIAQGLLATEPGKTHYKRTLATVLLDLSAVEYDTANFAGSAQSAGRANELLLEVANAPQQESHPLDGMFLAASFHRSAAAQRELGNNKAALTDHEKAVSAVRRLLQSGEDNNIRHALGRYLVEQGRTFETTAGGRSKAIASYDEAVQTWLRLRDRNKGYLQYQEWLAVAYTARGRAFVTNREVGRADEDLAKARSILEDLDHRKPDVADYGGHLGEAYAATAELETSRGEAALADGWRQKAVQKLTRAVAQSPADAFFRRALAAVSPGPAGGR